MGHFNKKNIHDNTNMTKETTTKLKIKNTYVPGLFGKPSLFTKIKLEWPLSRGSHFKIYFRLECRGNRGSRQNFYGIPFSKDHILINPVYFVPLTSHAYIKTQAI